MKVLYGLAAVALVVFVAIHLYDRQVQKNAVRDASRDAYWRGQHELCTDEVMKNVREPTTGNYHIVQREAWLQDERQKAMEFCQKVVAEARSSSQ